MNQQDTFYLTASICIVVSTALLAYITYHLVKTLRLAQSNLALTEDTLKDVKTAKDSFKSGVSGILMLVAKSLERGGDSKNG